MADYTISVSEGDVNLKHNIDRDYAKSHSNETIDLSRSHRNRVLIMDERLVNGMTIEEAFNDEFSEAVDEYNATKKKSRDKIQNYYEKVKTMKASGHAMKPVHEIVLQIGNADNNSVLGGDDAEALADILDTRIKQFQEDYPDLIIWYAVGHMDEATYHVHLGYSTPVYCPDAKRGLKYKVSQNECLENMGIRRGAATVKKNNGQEVSRTQSLKEMFYEDMKDRIEDEMLDHGFTREIKDEHNIRKSVSNFKAVKLLGEATQRDMSSKQREMIITEREKAQDERERTYKAHIKAEYDKAYKSKVETLKAEYEAKKTALAEGNDAILQADRERLQAEFDKAKEDEFKKMKGSLEKWKAEYKNKHDAEFQALEDQLEAQNKVKLAEALKEQVSDVQSYRQWKRSGEAGKIIGGDTPIIDKSTDFQ